MTSRERFVLAINHKQPDRVPLDIGATAVTGIHAIPLSKLRERLSSKARPVIVYEVLQQLGLVDFEDIGALKADVCGILPYYNYVGVNNKEYGPYDNSFGIEALCAKDYRTVRDPGSGYTYAYPQGDLTANPSMRMPKGGYFFDNIDRSPDTLDSEILDAKLEYAESFTVMDDEEAEFYRKQAEYIVSETDLGAIGNLAPAAFGDFAFLPGPSLRVPRGIRTITDFTMAHKLRPEYVHDVYALQCEIGLKNLEIYRQAVGDSIQAIFMGGTDFGTQRALMMSEVDFRAFYFPYWRTVNDWVHTNTKWKTFYHTCGSVAPLIPVFVEAGADILNPVQCSAYNMDARMLKEQFGDKVVFWGGGMDTQYTLPRGTTDQVRAMVRERIKIFAPNGGFVFNTVHNILGDTPIANIEAMLDEFFKCQ